MSLEYRSSISSRPTYTRKSVTSYHSVQSAASVQKSRSMDYDSDIGTEAMLYTSQNVASSILSSQDREKKEMQGLNDRLGTFIDKVRTLEAENRKLAEELESLRGKWGKDTTNVRSMYEGELRDARKQIDDAAKDKARIEFQTSRLQDDLLIYRQKYEEVMHLRESDEVKLEFFRRQLESGEAEIPMLRDTMKQTEEEFAKFKTDNNTLDHELEQIKKDLDEETLNRLDYQNQTQTLMEELEFMRRVHEQEVRELQSLVHAPRNKDFFKNELSLAVRDIRTEYHSIANANKKDTENWYKLKVQEVQTAATRQKTETGFQKDETKRLRDQLADLRNKLADLENKNLGLEKQVQELTFQVNDDQRQYEDAVHDRDLQLRKMREECQALMIELQRLLDTKQYMDSEIALYRKILEGEEGRTGDGPGRKTASTSSTSSSKEEKTTKQTKEAKEGKNQTPSKTPDTPTKN